MKNMVPLWMCTTLPPPPLLFSPPHNLPLPSLSPPPALPPPNSSRFSPENPSMSVTTTETIPPVGAPLSRLRASNRLWSSCGRLFLRSKKNLGGDVLRGGFTDLPRGWLAGSQQQTEKQDSI